MVSRLPSVSSTGDPLASKGIIPATLPVSSTEIVVGKLVVARAVLIVGSSGEATLRIVPYEEIDAQFKSIKTPLLDDNSQHSIYAED